MNLFRSSLAAVFIGSTLCACGIPLSDTVESDPEAPLSRAAAKAWGDCIAQNIEIQARDSRRRQAIDLVPAIVASCEVEKHKAVELAREEHFNALSNSLDDWYRPASVVPMLQIARAKREGVDEIKTLNWDGRMNAISPAEFQLMLQRWDDCTDAAAIYFARGNPMDDATALARIAALEYCGMFRQIAIHDFLEPPAPHDANALGKIVDRHEVERRPKVAVLIRRVQGQQRNSL